MCQDHHQARYTVQNIKIFQLEKLEAAKSLKSVLLLTMYYIVSRLWLYLAWALLGPIRPYWASLALLGLTGLTGPHWPYWALLGLTLHLRTD